MTEALYKLPKQQSVTEYDDDIDVDALLAQLTPEEIEELGLELIDPDDSHIPAADRCRYRTDKAPTGPYNRKKLLAFLEKKAKEEKDWDDAKPYVKEIRGKVFKPKEVEKAVLNDDVQVETEWDDALANATEEELVDLAALLGFHGMLNQVQYHQAFVNNEGIKESSSGFCGVAKHQDFKLYDDEAINSTDVPESIEKLKANDPKLTHLNINNIKDQSIDTLCSIAEALKTNTHLERLEMASTRASDKVAMAFAAALPDNKTLRTLNLESNYISGAGIIAVLNAVNQNQTLTALHFANQRPQVLGVQRERQIAELVKENKTLLKFGIFMESRANQMKINEYTERNHDGVRRVRMNQPLTNGTVDPPPQPKTSRTKEPAAKKEEEVVANDIDELSEDEDSAEE